jgi:glutamine cyclotransferase
MTIQPIIELLRKPAHEPEPHSVASDGKQLWIGSRASKCITVLDPATWSVLDVIEPPGMPWGMTYGDSALVMTCGESTGQSDDDTRRIRRYVPGTGFEDGYVQAPEDTGAHLALFEGHILLGQWYKQRLLLLDRTGAVLDTYAVPHQIAGVVVRDSYAYLLTTDDEERGSYWITRLALREPATPALDIALVPFRARSLAWDGERFWTNHREADQTVSFRLPG